MATPITQSFPLTLRGQGATPEVPVIVDAPSHVLPAGYVFINAQGVMNQTDIDNPAISFRFQVMFDRGNGPEQLGGELDFQGGGPGRNGGLPPPPGTTIQCDAIAGKNFPAWIRLTLPQPLPIGGSITLT